MDVESLKIRLNSMISITDLTQAEAKNIFDSLHKDEVRIVLKNNRQIAALVSMDRYQELLDKEEDLQLIKMSLNRMLEKQDTISRKVFLKIMV